MKFPRGCRSGAWAAVVALTLLGTAACGDDSENDSEANSSTSTLACAGDPITLTMIANVTGPLAFSGIDQDLNDGVTAAISAINGSCQLGRPLAVKVCDDKSDVNLSIACGRDAKADGTLAMMSGPAFFDDGFSAAGLPALLTKGAGLFDLTNPLSYPVNSAPAYMLAMVTAAKSAGASDLLFVAPDTPGLQAFVSQAVLVGDQVGVKVNPLYYPPETTDFAPVAAQAAGKDPGALGFIASAPVPFINAMAGEGLTPESLPMLTAGQVISPEVVAELGSKAEGLYLPTNVAPTSESDNAGIKQMLSEYEAAGLEADPADIGLMAVDTWASVHTVADAIAKLPEADRQSLTSESLAAALVASSPIERPEMAPVDLNTPAFPDFPALASFRIFSRELMIVRITDGAYKAVSGFQDVTKAFALND